ncbi:MAG TPA: DUF305 domain-containing protein [Candidatus Saccharibacteria bacterium]|nr:DUF305 domain-containing protein [Candidatus Saccharibacteria bacterium]HRK94575.1 DUF305 domain-containing protein [Candidatus Saccharibacteria bacterium]
MKVTRNKLSILVLIVLAIVAAGVWYIGIFSIKPEKTAVKDAEANTTATNKKAPDNKFASLKGDAFDEAYIADMLAHHEGAVNMSEQAMSVTAHEEIRTLASNITQTQSIEMMQMREWQKAWGFEITNNGGHMSHGGGGAAMAGDMVEMMNKLKGLTGEAYDEEYLRQMILHHEQAIEMSVDADTNAKRQEVKDLAQGVIEAQTAEIKQMKQWQKEWGYES